MPAYDFGQTVASSAPTGSREQMSAVLDLRGLDLSTPVDLIDKGRTPFAKNFRLYAQQSDSRRVAVSSRKGPDYYIDPLGEALVDSNVSTTGASTADVSIITGVHAIPFTAPNSNRITRIDLGVGNLAGATAPVVVEIWSDQTNSPYKKLSESSYTSGDILDTVSYVTARFIDSPQIESGLKYWIVLRQQDDGDGAYQLGTTTAGTKAWKTDSTLSMLTEQTYAINYKLYTAIDQADKGAYRFNRDNGENITIVAYGETMYYIDESAGVLVPIIDGLSSNATEYNFTNGDNKVFWANAYDELTTWNGVHESLAPNLIQNGSFTVDATGWAATGGGSGAAVARSTAAFNSTPASLTGTASSGARVARQSLVLTKNKRYKVSYWVRSVSGTGNHYVNGYLASGNINIVPATTITTTWQYREEYVTISDDTIAVGFNSDNVDFYIDDVSIIDTGIEYIIDTELDIPADVLMHKDRIWTRSSIDGNKLQFSEAPGNPSNSPTAEQWYRAYRSVNFWYVPRPYNGSPVTAMKSFQDALTVFTQDKKYIISGYDLGSFTLRESTGSKGALSGRGVSADENNIFFVSKDGLYVYNGSSDKKISDLIGPLFDACGQKRLITPVIWKNEVRFYNASQGSAHNDSCWIWNKDLEEWQYDTDTYINRALFYNDADDNSDLVEFSSVVPTAYYGEQGYHSLGAAIDFEYRLKYDSMDTPGQKKRIKRFVPILQGVDSKYELTLAMDKDFQDSPKIKEVMLTNNGMIIGEFDIGDGTLVGGDTTFNAKRQSYSGYAKYWQLRVIRKAVNNRVAFIGAQFTYKTKRL